jgi:hypothetical protein
MQVVAVAEVATVAGKPVEINNLKLGKGYDWKA